MLRLSLRVSIAAAPLLFGCSSASSPAEGEPVEIVQDPNARVGEIRGSDTWKNGTILSGVVVIGKDARVTIEPGATITCTPGAALYVEGTMVAKAKDAHAKITCPTWGGLVVSAGGMVDLEGLDVENAGIGLAVAPGARDSRFVEGSLTGALKPFVVSHDSSLVLTQVRATAIATPVPGQPSGAEVQGTAVISRLDYDARGGEGISVRAGGVLDMADSIVRGERGTDLVSAYGAKKIKLSYSTFRGSHCGIHLQPSESFEIDHVTSESETASRFTVPELGRTRSKRRTSRAPQRGLISQVTTVRLPSKTSTRRASRYFSRDRPPPGSRRQSLRSQTPSRADAPHRTIRTIRATAPSLADGSTTRPHRRARMDSLAQQ